MFKKDELPPTIGIGAQVVEEFKKADEAGTHRILRDILLEIDDQYKENFTVRKLRDRIAKKLNTNTLQGGIIAQPFQASDPLWIVEYKEKRTKIRKIAVINLHTENIGLITDAVKSREKAYSVQKDVLKIGNRQYNLTDACLQSMTDIESVQDILRMEDSDKFKALRNQYIVKDKNNPFVFGWLLDPEEQIADKYGLDTSQYKAKAQLRSNDEVIELLQRAKREKLPLEVTCHLRGIDGPGSSQDLIRFQVKMTVQDKEFTWMFDMPCTTAFASEFDATIRVEAADEGDEDSIVYIAPDYFKGKRKTTFEDAKELEAAQFNDESKQTKKEGLVWMGDLPAYSLAKYFGITKGVKVTCLPTRPLPRAGGMESSNAFSVTMYAIGGMLSGANWSWAKIIKQAVYDENNIYTSHTDGFNPGITGGQGHIASVFGGLNTIIWLSGFGSRGILECDEYVYSNDSYAALVAPLQMEQEELDSIGDIFSLVQPGKWFGPDAPDRTAFDTNFEWTEEWKDPIGQRLHLMKMYLHYIYRQAIIEGNHEAVAYTLNMYSHIRNALNARYKEWYYEQTGEKARGEGAIGYMDDLSKPLFEDVQQVGGGLMPAGAGGLGSICIHYYPKSDMTKKGNPGRVGFYRKHKIPRFDEGNANKVMATEEGKALLQGYLPYKLGMEPARLSEGWANLGMQAPSQPIPVVVNQATGKIMLMEKFTEETGKQLPEFAQAMLETGAVPQVVASKETTRAVQHAQ